MIFLSIQNSIKTKSYNNTILRIWPSPRAQINIRVLLHINVLFHNFGVTSFQFLGKMRKGGSVKVSKTCTEAYPKMQILIACHTLYLFQKL